MKTYCLRMSDAAHAALTIDSKRGPSINDLICALLTLRYAVECQPDKQPKYFKTCKGRPVKPTAE